MGQQTDIWTTMCFYVLNEPINKQTDNNSILPGDVTAEVANLESREKGDHLYGLSQAHLVPHDAPSLLTVQLPQPLHANLLVSEVKDKLMGGEEGGRGREREGGRGRKKG